MNYLVGTMTSGSNLKTSPTQTAAKKETVVSFYVSLPPLMKKKIDSTYS
jgi:hypothetical protein